jgi:hypothetical protein
MSVLQENEFLIGLDLESDIRDIDAGFYTYLLNGTTNSTFERNLGAAESITSNIKVTNFWDNVSKQYRTFSLPSGTNRCIGWCQDLKNSALIFFNYNSNGYHAIYRYWVKPQTISPFIEALTLYVPGSPPLTWGSVLGFTLENKIYNAKIIETAKVKSDWTVNPEHPVFGNDIPVQLLFFTDGNQPQRRLDTSDLFLILQESYVFDQYWINVAKQAPQKSPSIIMDVDANRKTNNLAYKHFQFRVRYKYKNGEYSSLSPISDISLLTKDDYLMLNFDRATSGIDNNYISISGGDAIHDTVDMVEAFVREGNGSSTTGATNPEWYRFAELKRGTDFGPTGYQVSYYGDEETFPLSSIESDTNFFTVPLLSRHQEVVEGNQVVYADCTEGQDKEPIEATIEYVTTEVELPLYPVYIIQGAWSSVGFIDIARVLDPTGREPGDIVGGTYEILQSGTGAVISSFVPYYYVLTSADIANIDVFGVNIAAYIQSTSLLTVSYNNIGKTLFGAVTGGRIISFPTSGSVYSKSPVDRSFKEGCFHKFGMIHYDSEMRQGNFEQLPDLYIPFVTETYPRSGSFAYVPEVYGVKLTVASKPPIWAKYYKLVHKKSISKTAMFLANNIAYVDNKLRIRCRSYTEFINGFNVTGGLTALPFNPVGVPDFVSSEWVGAKIRFLTQEQSGFIANTSKVVLNEYIQARVLSIEDVTVSSVSMLQITVSDFGFPSMGIGNNTLFEIYKEGYEPVYFELPISESANGYGTIENPGEEDREYDFQAAGFLETYLGDTYKRWRIMRFGQYHIESFSISDWWASEYDCRGRIQAETPNMSSQRIRTMLRWSGKLFQNTNINNTNVFDEGNYRILETKFGAIEGIRQIGYTLKVAMWGNIASVFIGRREVQNADASTQLVITDSLIGTVNYSEDKYGCKHAGSIYVNDRTMYFFDIINRCFCKNDPNGSDDISQKKAQRYWQDLSQTIQEDGLDVITGYDHSMGLIFVTIKKETATTENSTTISFAVKKGFWHGFHTFEKAISDTFLAIDNMGNIGSSMACFLNGEVWLMNGGSDDLNLFGDDVAFKAGCATNIQKESVKVFMNHVCRSNRRPNKSTQTIPYSDTNPNGMESYIPGGKYLYKEGVYYSDCNNNKNTFGVPTTIEQTLRGLVSGDKLRGHACDTVIEFTGNEKVILKSSSMGVIPSPKS